MRAKIITDSMCDIPLDVAESYGIEIIPISVSLDNGYVNEGEVDTRELADWMDKNQKAPSFKGVSTETFVKIFEKYIKEGMEIIYISSGSESISNYDCACHASTRFPNANIHVIDSRHASGSTAMMALKAAIMAGENESVNAIAIKLERSTDKFKHFGLADKVDFLKYSGLCPRFIAVGVNLLNVKFEFAMLQDRKFDVQMAGTSMSRAISNYVSNIFRDLHSIDSKVIFLMHTVSDDNYFAELYKRIEGLNYFDEIVVCDGGLYTTSLVGRNGMSVAYMLK